MSEEISMSLERRIPLPIGTMVVTNEEVPQILATKCQGFNKPWILEHIDGCYDESHPLISHLLSSGKIVLPWPLPISPNGLKNMIYGVFLDACGYDETGGVFPDYLSELTEGELIGIVNKYVYSGG